MRYYLKMDAHIWADLIQTNAKRTTSTGYASTIAMLMRECFPK